MLFRSLVGQYNINIDGSDIIVPQYNQVAASRQSSSGDSLDYSKMQRLPNQINANQSNGKNKLLQQYGYGSGFNDSTGANISIELGTNDDVGSLEILWDDLSKKYSRELGVYEPYYSVDTPADGQGKELFHLRVGPIKTLEEGDAICSGLGRNGVFCSVVRTQ